MGIPSARRRPADNEAEAMTTIQEVARHAKVSTATVSRVLNNHSTVHPDLVLREARVIDAVRTSFGKGKATESLAAFIQWISRTRLDDRTATRLRPCPTGPYCHARGC